LLVLGIAGTAANALRPVFGLTLLGLLVTVTGTLVMTGNFDVARVGGAVPYVYVLAGVGAAGVLAVAVQAWGWVGRWLAVALLAAAVAAAGWENTRDLIALWTNPSVLRAHRNNLAYLTVWLRDHAKPGERVLGIAPGYANVLEMHDGGWLRGRDVDGFVTWDIESALRRWEREPGPTLVFVYDGSNTESVAHFLESLFPELRFQIDADPLDMHADIAYARVPGPPPELAARLADWHCRGARTQFVLEGPTDGEVLFKVETVSPVISRATWPAAVPDTLYRLTTRPSRIRARYEATFRVQTSGDYRFYLATYAGTGTVAVDGQPLDSLGHAPRYLDAGMHTLEVKTEFAPMAIEPAITLLWSGPDTKDHQQLMPLYQVGSVDPTCAGAAGQEPFAALGRSGKGRYLTAWLVAGPFPSPNGAGARRDDIDVRALGLSAAARDAVQWRPIPPHEAFVDLDGFLAGGGASPEWVCAYAVTTLDSPVDQGAFLELAGSGDLLRVWLNGAELTGGPMAFGYEPLRRAIDLRAGENLLVIRSCEAIGAWYFVARVSDAQGADLSNVTARAGFPQQPGPALLEPVIDVQLIDGFGELIQAKNTGEKYDDYRGGSRSWWAYVRDQDPVVSWRTAPAAERKRTVIAATVSTSVQNGAGELSVNGRKVLDFPVGTHGLNGVWQSDGYQAAFVSKGFFDGNSGIMLLSVPEEAVTPGQPLELSVRLTGGSEQAWFMIKSYADTVAHEQLVGSQAQAYLQGLWEPVRATQ
jgi:hypothetical protein